MATEKQERRVSFTEIEDGLKTGIFGADALRADGLGALVKVKRAKLATLGREKSRLEGKLGRGHERVRKLDHKADATTRLSNEAVFERDRARAAAPDKDPKAWVAYGFVRDAKGVPLAGVGVVLGPDPRDPSKALTSSRTDAKGAFELRLTDLPASDTPGRFDRTRENARYLHVVGENGRPPASDDRALYPRPGAREFRQITVGKAEQVTKEKPWVVAGRVRDAQGEPLAGVTVRLVDRQGAFAERLDPTKTDADGAYRLAFTQEKLPELFEARPELFLRVLGADGKTLFAARNAVQPEAGRTEKIEVKVSRGPGRQG